MVELGSVGDSGERTPSRGVDLGLMILLGCVLDLRAIDDGGLVWWFSHRPIFPAVNLQVPIGRAVQEWSVVSVLPDSYHKTGEERLLVGAPVTNDVFVGPLRHGLGEAPVRRPDELEYFGGNALGVGFHSGRVG